MWKLLRKNISAGQLTGFSIANLIGLTIVILAVLAIVFFIKKRRKK